MPKRIVFENELLEVSRNNVNVVEAPVFSVPTNPILAPLETTGYVYFTQNKLIIKLMPEDDTTENFSILLGPGSTGQPPPEQFSLADTTVLMNAYWSRDTSIRPTDLSRYQQIDITPDIISVARDKIVLQIPEEQITYIEDYFTGLGMIKPRFGFMSVVISCPGFSSRRFWFKQTQQNLIFSARDITPDIATPSIADNSFVSSPHTFESLFVPALTASFVYNTFEVNENSFEMAKNRNYQGKNIIDIPKYVHLKWTKAPIILHPILVPPTVPVPVVTAPTSSVPTARSSGPTLVPPTAPVPTTRDASPPPVSPTIRLGGFTFTPETSDSIGAALMGSDSTATGADARLVFDRTAPGGVSVGSTTTFGGDTLFAPGREPSLTDAATAGVLGAGDPTSIVRDARKDVVASLNEKTRYTGYIIFKERYDEVNDEWIPDDLIAIPHRTTTYFIDWKIGYGFKYRYKIRSICKFIVPEGTPIYEDTDRTINTRKTADQYFRDGVVLASGFYFDSEYSVPEEIEAIDLQSPEIPFNFQIVPNSTKKQIFLTWNQKNTNKDVAGFNVYRKHIKEDFFELLNSNLLDIRSNFYVDELIKYDNEYIYAVEAQDVHGNRSALSNQYIASIRVPNLEHDRQERPIKLHHLSGEELEPIIKNPTKEITEFSKKFDIIINPLFGNLDQETTFLLKITSLDTFMEKEVKLNFKTKVINHIAPRVFISTREPLVPTKTAERGIEDHRRSIVDRSRIL